MGDLVETVVEGGICHIRLNRPEVMNALNRAMRAEWP
jgi:enoyl-CoA hydratase/carnithine racemase